MTDLTPEDLDELERHCPAGHYICKETGAALDIPMPVLIAAARERDATADARDEALFRCKVLGEQVFHLRKGMEGLRRRAALGDDFDLESDIEAFLDRPDCGGSVGTIP